MHIDLFQTAERGGVAGEALAVVEAAARTGYGADLQRDIDDFPNLAQLVAEGCDSDPAEQFLEDLHRFADRRAELIVVAAEETGAALDEVGRDALRQGDLFSGKRLQEVADRVRSSPEPGDPRARHLDLGDAARAIAKRSTRLAYAVADEPRWMDAILGTAEVTFAVLLVTLGLLPGPVSTWLGEILGDAMRIAVIILAALSFAAGLAILLPHVLRSTRIRHHRRRLIRLLERTRQRVLDVVVFDATRGAFRALTDEVERRLQERGAVHEEYMRAHTGAAAAEERRRIEQRPEYSGYSPLEPRAGALLPLQEKEWDLAVNSVVPAFDTAMQTFATSVADDPEMCAAMIHGSAEDIHTALTGWIDGQVRRVVTEEDGLRWLIQLLPDDTQREKLRQLIARAFPPCRTRPGTPTPVTTVVGVSGSIASVFGDLLSGMTSAAQKVDTGCPDAIHVVQHTRRPFNAAEIINTGGRSSRLLRQSVEQIHAHLATPQIVELVDAAHTIEGLFAAPGTGPGSGGTGQPPRVRTIEVQGAASTAPLASIPMHAPVAAAAKSSVDGSSPVTPPTSSAE